MISTRLSGVITRCKIDERKQMFLQQLSMDVEVEYSPAGNMPCSYLITNGNNTSQHSRRGR